MADWKEALEQLVYTSESPGKEAATIRAHIEGLEANIRSLSPLNYEERCRLRDAEARVRELEAHVADRESEIDVLKAERARAEARTDYTGLRGFGFTFDAETGRVRNWYIDPNGVKRWADDDSRVEAEGK